MINHCCEYIDAETRLLIENLEGNYRELVDGADGRWKMLMGDLARLRRDAIDENYVCEEIARRTGLDPDDVAAVLLAFMEMP